MRRIRRSFRKNTNSRFTDRGFRRLVAKAFGVPTAGGYAKRQSFLVKDGKIVWRDLNASTKNQATDVRAALENLK